MARRKLTEAANHFGGVLATARWQGRIKQLEKPSSSQREIAGAGPTYNRRHREIGDSAARQATRQVLHSVVDAQRAEELMRSWGERLIDWGMRRGLARGKVEGRAEGRAEGVLRILAARRVYVHDEARQRILSCTDISLLDRWFDRALDARSLSDVLDEPAQ